MNRDARIEHALATAAARHRAGRLLDAAAIYQQVLARQPQHADARHLLGLICHQTGDGPRAIEHLTQAARLDPQNPAIHLNLGEAYRAQGRWDEAGACYERALAIQPDNAAAHNNLGLVCKQSGRLDAARQHFERALTLQPDSADACNNLARALMAAGRIEEAVARYRQAVNLSPADAFLHSNLIFALHFHPGLGADDLDREHARWDARHAGALRSRFASAPNDPDPERRLRVGYVSADFCQHPVSFFLYPLLSQHDRARFEVYAYSGVKRPDAVTTGFQKLTSVWRDTRGWSDDQLALQIRADRIDILVDLGMHASNSRLLVFARRPAPVQVGWLAYPGTTGVEAIDYRLSDGWMDPATDATAEAPGGIPVPLPDAWCCYHPLGQTPAVADLPARRPGANGAVTFGCLNSFNKVNDAVLRRWARVLAAVPDSRLLLHSPSEAAIHERVRTCLAQAAGIAGERVEFVGSQGRTAYLETYGRIDVGLDPFPFGGMTTTCEALWMGVPVPACLGQAPGSRVGASLLAAVGLRELIARDEDTYVESIRALAGDLPRLADLRRTLRARMESSPLMDAPRFARNVERAYCAMWQRWCQQNP